MSSSKRGVGWGIAVGLLGAACTRPNPGYGLEGGDPSEGTASAGSVGDGTVTFGPGDTTVSGGSVGEGTVSGGSEPELCLDDGDCADDVFCNGTETCAPGRPDADERGCVDGPGDPCMVGTQCDEDQARCVTNCEMGSDADGDKVDSIDCGGLDCDDNEKDVHPGVDEVCDEIDDDCDPLTIGGEDADGDGEVSNLCCNPTDVGPRCGGDCDDTEHGITGPPDWAHCGECGNACGELQVCILGDCVDGRSVFITSGTSLGNMGGLLGADDRCQEHAAAGGHPGMFRAFLVDGSNGLERLQHDGVPYVRLDGVPIADDWEDLVDGTIAAPLDIDERREPLNPLDARAWTGLSTLTGKAAFDANCVGWTSAEEGCNFGEGEPCGSGGDALQTNESWAAVGFQVDCGMLPHHLYCIEQDM